MEQSIPEFTLSLVVVNTEQRIDSRQLATNIGVQHDNLMQTIRKYQDGMEKYGVILFETGVKSGPQRGKLPQYALLNKEQFGYLLMFVKVTDIVRAFREYVYDRFLASEVKALPTPEQIFNRSVQDRCIRNEKLLKPGVFCVVTEMYREAWTLEAFQHELKPSSLPDGSCGRKWRNWLIEQQHPLLGKSYQVLLHVPIERGHDLRSVWVYPLELLMVFRAWLRETYAEYYTVSYSPSRLLTSEAKAIAGPK